MTAPQRPARFVLAPVVNGAAAWSQATVVKAIPIRLPYPIVLALSFRQRWLQGLPR